MRIGHRSTRMNANKLIFFQSAFIGGWIIFVVFHDPVSEARVPRRTISSISRSVSLLA